MEDAGKRLLIRTSFAEALGAVTSEGGRGRQVGGSDHAPEHRLIDGRCSTSPHGQLQETLPQRISF